MRLAVVIAALASVLSTSIAHAGVVSGTTILVQPSTDPEEGGGSLWAAGVIREHLYVGGDFAMGTFDSKHLGISLHALAGVKGDLHERVAVLADVGAGITNHASFKLGLFGGESGFEDEGTSPSGAVRLHLVGQLGCIGTATVGVGLSSEVRSTLEGEAGVGVGLGLYMMR